MADSIEQKLINAIVTRLRTILTTGGYVTNIGVNVADSQPNWDQEDDLPAISVFEGTVASQEDVDEGLTVTRTMPVLIKCFMARQDTSAADAAFARNAIKDIFQAIRGYDKWVSSSIPLATFTSEKSHGIEYTENSFEITGVQVEIEIQYGGDKFNLEA